MVKKNLKDKGLITIQLLIKDILKGENVVWWKRAFEY